MQIGATLGGPPSAVASCGAWQDERTYHFRTFFRATPFSWVGTLTLDGDAAQLDLRSYVHFDRVSPVVASLRGRLT
jgi:hypothetical protein